MQIDHTDISGGGERVGKDSLSLRRKPDDFLKVIRFFCVYKSLSTLRLTALVSSKWLTVNDFVCVCAVNPSFKPPINSTAFCKFLIYCDLRRALLLMVSGQTL